MNEPHSENIPSPGKDFEEANAPSSPPDQETEQEQAFDQEEELNYDPPELVFDPGRVMVPTPFGTMEENVQLELDPAAQQAIREAQEKEPELEEEFHDLRSIDDVPGAEEEYQQYLDETEPEADDFNQRMIDQFNHWREQEPDHDH